MNKRVALITGCTGEIGSEIALQLSKAGFQLALGYNNNKTRAVELSKELNASIHKIDLSNRDEITNATEQIFNQHSRLDTLVNAAAINIESPALSMEDDIWSKVIEINLTGAFRLARAVGKYMMLARFGRIINISSVAARMGGRGQINYAAAKAGVERMTRTLALELGRKGITANCIAPGIINTAMSERLRENHSQELLNAISVKRFGEPKDIASLACYLASESASYINGQTIAVDGGMGL